MKKWENLLSRRDFLKLSAASGATVLLSNCAGGLWRPIGRGTHSDFMTQYGPIDRTLDDTSLQFFFGDNNSRPHGILWSLPNYLTSKKIESPIEETTLAIIGGGMSGLFSAYQFRRHCPIILEQASRLGGNAKGQSWRGLDYSIGAAYLDSPQKGHPMNDYFKELGFHDLLTPRKEPDPIESNGTLYYKFWEGETEPQAIAKYKKMNAFFAKLNEEEERAFPYIPALTPGQMDAVKYYDQWSLHGALTKIMGSTLPQKLETAIEHYCWSSYACSARELSAAAGLNSLAQESNPIMIPSGGNAKIGERILERLLREIPSSHFRCNSVAMDVKVNADHVLITYEDAQKKFRQIKAKGVIMACPKFIAAKIIPGLEENRLRAISKLRYRSYMTANLLVKKKMERRAYDVFMIGKGKTNMSDIRSAQDKMNATDFIMANFSDLDTDINVLTFYRAFPYEGARAELNNPNAFTIYKKKFEDQIARDILPLMKIEAKDIVDLRLALWGHALPVSAKGIYRDDTIPTLRKPFRDRVFFVEQDNWAYPSTQTGATDVALMKHNIDKILV